MARVNVEETIYASIPIVQSYTGWAYPTIIGHLILLWRFSQEALRSSGTSEEICDWAWVTKDQEMFVKGLVKGKFLREAPCMVDDASSMLVASPGIGHPLYLIAGNEKHVLAHKVFKERAKKAAAARWGNYLEVGGKQGEIPDQRPEKPAPDPKKNASSIENHASSMLDDASTCPIQFNSIQCNSKQNKKKKTNPGIRTEYPPVFDRVWVQYQRKGDKKEAYGVWKDLDLTDPEQEMLEKAIAFYQRGKPEIRFRKDFERFLKMDWRELAIDLPNNGLNGHGNGVHPETAQRIASFERLNAQFEAEARGGRVPHA